jgi:hypothetical protein
MADHTCSYYCDRPSCIKAQRDELRDRLAHFKFDAVLAEREACAKLLDEMAAQDHYTNYYVVAAKAIRARGEK